MPLGQDQIQRLTEKQKSAKFDYKISAMIPHTTV